MLQAREVDKWEEENVFDILSEIVKGISSSGDQNINGRTNGF
jgi:hypothetical protein